MVEIRSPRTRKQRNRCWLNRKTSLTVSFQFFYRQWLLPAARTGHRNGLRLVKRFSEVLSNSTFQVHARSAINTPLPTLHQNAPSLVFHHQCPNISAPPPTLHHCSAISISPPTLQQRPTNNNTPTAYRHSTTNTPSSTLWHQCPNINTSMSTCHQPSAIDAPLPFLHH